MDVKNIDKSKTVRGVLIFIVIAIAIILVFQAGVLVGYRKAAFSYGMGDNYYRAFGPEHRVVFLGFDRDDLSSAHGATGKIVKVSLPTFTVESPDNVEKVIHVTDQSIIRRMKDVASSSDLSLGEYVVVLGMPNDASEIDASLIRILPPPPPLNSGTSSPQ